jgi:acyl phosphate:glycerol-3-phosphate acyltransferase
LCRWATISHSAPPLADYLPTSLDQALACFNVLRGLLKELCRMACSLLIGAIPFAQLVAKRAGGVDLRTAHPESVSATGVYRAAGLAPFLVVSALDVAKGYVAVRLAGRERRALAWHAGLAVAGHNWSPFMRGVGGRGITPAAGALVRIDRWGAVLLLGGPTIGYACRATGLGSFVSQLLLLLCRRRCGVLPLIAVLIPIWTKRILGNDLEVRGGLPVARVLERLLYDRDRATTRH